MSIRCEQLEQITNSVKSYKKEHIECALQPEEVIDFLERMPTTKDKLKLAKSITNDTKCLYPILVEIKPLLTPNFKRIKYNFFSKNIQSLSCMKMVPRITL